MNKIIQKLLEVTYPTLNIESLLEIVNVTPNPELATEMLCGLYVEPTIKNKFVISSSDSEGILTFVSYDKWQDRVNYSYERAETKNGYFPKTVRKEDVTMENFDSLRCSWQEGVTHSITIPTGKVEQATSYVSLSRWNSLKPVE